MKVVIMAGGRGERLKPLTNTIPKPMIDINGKPVLEHIINLFKKNGIKDFIITLCYLPEKITEYFDDGSKFGVNIDYFFENPKKPLGTAGAIGQLKEKLKDTFIVTSGDVLRVLDIKKMIKHHKKKKSFATLNVYKRFGSDPKSMIMFDSKNKIKEFIERPKKESLKSDFVWANGSFYIFEPKLCDFIPENQTSDFGKDIFPKLLAKKKNIYAYPTSEFFIDIGNFEKLEKARKWIKS